MSSLEQIKQFSVVVADTANYQSLAEFGAADATTNPSLILAAAKLPTYQDWMKNQLASHRAKDIDEQMDILLVEFGLSILSQLKKTPQQRRARVSTEVDARLSFDVGATVSKAKHLIALYAKAGVSKEEVLIKIASTWEGIQAAKQLQTEGIQCNLTLLFSEEQARACADAKVQLISPFVGRVSDWAAQKGLMTKAEFGDPIRDPGVVLVRAIYQFYKSTGIPTEVMAASFRNTRQVLALSGCDLLTISPSLLSELQQGSEPVTRVLNAVEYQKKTSPGSSPALLEKDFRFALNQNEMANDKLAEGIRLFVKAIEDLSSLIKDL